MGTSLRCRRLYLFAVDINVIIYILFYNENYDTIFIDILFILLIVENIDIIFIVVDIVFTIVD